VTAISGTMRLASASGKQFLRSHEIWATVLLFPGALLAILWVFSELSFEFGSQEVALMDFWVTGMGVLGVALGNTHAFLANIATWKAGSVLKRISVTPITAGQLIIGEVIPRALVGMVTVVAFLAVGNALGANIMLGSELIEVLVVMFMVTAIGLSTGFIIAGVTKTPQNANALDTAVSWPLYFFTGAMVPLAAFPPWVGDIAQIIPYTGLIATIRGLVLGGRPLTDFGPELAIAAVWMVALIALAARTYRFVK
jgi:ABC-2 type transport system permease protein